MKVKDLIEELTKLNGDSEVSIIRTVETWNALIISKNKPGEIYIQKVIVWT